MKLTKMLLCAAALTAGTIFAAEPAAAPKAEAPKEAPQQFQMPSPEQMEKMNSDIWDGILKDYPDVLGEVEGKKMTKADFKKELIDAKFPAFQLAQIPADKQPGILKKFVRELLAMGLLRKEAEKAGFKFTPEFAYDLLMKEFSGAKPEEQKMVREQIKQQTGKELEVYLKERLNNPKAVEGIVMGNFQKGIYDKYMKEATDAKLEVLYNNHKESFRKEDMVQVSHILILCPAGEVKKHMESQMTDAQKKRTDADALKIINDAKARIDKGEDFAKVAKEVSECPSKEQGGMLPPFGHNQMVPEFEKAAFAMSKAGEVSAPVKTDFGYHLIKFHKIDKAGYESFADVKESLKLEYAKTETAKYFTGLVDNWEKAGKIRIYIQVPAPKEIQEAKPAVKPAPAPAPKKDDKTAVPAPAPAK